jgi:hypothetical protein
MDENRSRNGRRSLDAVLVEVNVAESTDMLMKNAGNERERRERS